MSGARSHSLHQVFGPSGRGSGGRLLLVSYHFPPGTGVGGLRWQQFARYAREFGWSLDVVTSSPPDGARRDPARLAQLPRETRVFVVPVLPSGLTRIERLLRRPGSQGRTTAAPGPAESPAEGNGRPGATLTSVAGLRWGLHTPAGWRRAYAVCRHYADEWTWANAASDSAVTLATDQPYDAVIGSGPPHLALMAAAAAARVGRTTLVLDLRDPWSLVPRIPSDLGSRLWLTLARHWERRAVRQAALTVMNTELATERMREAYPEYADRFVTVLNGMDDEQIPAVPPPTHFVVAYAGNIYTDRDPTNLFRGARRLIAERGLTPEHVTLEFMGHAERLNGFTLEQIAEREGVGPFVRRHPPGPRADAMRFLAGASLLVSLPQGTSLSTPSKVFEYMLFSAWHLILAEPDTATARTLRGSAMPVVAPGDIEGIHALLADRYDRFVRGERPAPLAGREQFARGTQAGRFFSAIVERRVRGAAP